MTQGCLPIQDLLIAAALCTFTIGHHSPFCLYGDAAYPLREHLQAPLKDSDSVLTSLTVDFNKSMSAVRESVESF